MSDLNSVIAKLELVTASIQGTVAIKITTGTGKKLLPAALKKAKIPFKVGYQKTKLLSGRVVHQMLVHVPTKHAKTVEKLQHQLHRAFRKAHPVFPY